MKYLYSIHVSVSICILCPNIGHKLFNLFTPNDSKKRLNQSKTINTKPPLFDMHPLWYNVKETKVAWYNPPPHHFDAFSVDEISHMYFVYIHKSTVFHGLPINRSTFRNCHLYFRIIHENIFWVKWSKKYFQSNLCWQNHTTKYILAAPSIFAMYINWNLERSIYSMVLRK